LRREREEGGEMRIGGGEGEDYEEREAIARFGSGFGGY